MASREQLRRVAVATGLLIAILLGVCYVYLARPITAYSNQLGGTLLNFLSSEQIELMAIGRYTYELRSGEDTYQLSLSPRLSPATIKEGDIIMAESPRYLLSGPQELQKILLQPTEVDVTVEGGSSTGIADFSSDDYKSLARAVTGAGVRSVDEGSEIEVSAVERGYRLVEEAEVVDLTVLSGDIQLKPSAVEAFNDLKEAVERLSGLELVSTSGFRSIQEQQDIFSDRLAAGCLNVVGACSAANPSSDVLSSVMDMAAPPGFSRHHSGLAVDVVEGFDGRIDLFDMTTTYEFMSQDNFALVREFGFIPSYPDGAVDQGPEPESWEYIYVGVELSR